MLKSITFAVGISAANAWSAVYDGTEGFAHDQVWGHDHYEPGDINRFNNHYAEIYGADDLAWGPNGHQNPLAAKDNIHNWDDQGDAYVCHACGGHGCSLCGGYGHFHRNAQFGYHGHGLMSGFGVGHWHAYLGPKVRSSYDRYGHGVGGRYSQRWTNGYGDRYGINGGERYGLNHRWGIYNGVGHGNPSSKGSNLGYGIGSNAEVPTLVHQPDYHYDDYYYGDEDYYYDDEDYYYDDEDYYGDEYYYAEEDDRMYEEPAPVEEEVALEVELFPTEEAYYPEEEEAYYPEEEAYYPEEEYYYGDYEPYYAEDYYGDRYADEYYPMDGEYYTDFATGYGDWGDIQRNPVGEGTLFELGFGNGHGNHSPWHGEYERNDRGLMNYMKRPTEVTVFHQPLGYYNN